MPTIRYTHNIQGTRNVEHTEWKQHAIAVEIDIPCVQWASPEQRHHPEWQLKKLHLLMNDLRNAAWNILLKKRSKHFSDEEQVPWVPNKTSELLKTRPLTRIKEQTIQRNILNFQNKSFEKI